MLAAAFLPIDDTNYQSNVGNYCLALFYLKNN